jgi:hypothetical protein
MVVAEVVVITVHSAEDQAVVVVVVMVVVMAVMLLVVLFREMDPRVSKVLVAVVVELVVLPLWSKKVWKVG